MRLFTQELQTTDEKTVARNWSGSPNGLRFRCKVCGHRFKVGDRYRFVYANGVGSPTKTGNFAVCEACNDTDEVLLDRMAEIEEEGYRRFWWLVEDDRQLMRWTEE